MGEEQGWGRVTGAVTSEHLSKLKATVTNFKGKYIWVVMLQQGETVRRYKGRR